MVFSKMLAKGMYLIEFENCIFFQLLKGELPLRSIWEGTTPQKLLRGNSPSDTRFLNFQRFIKVLTKSSKQEKLEDFSDMIMYPIVYLKRFFSKMLPNGMYQIGRIEFQKWIVFSSSGGHIHPQTPPCPRGAGAPLWSLPLQHSHLPGKSSRGSASLCLSFVPFMLGLIKGIFSDSNNIFLWHESEDINKKSLNPKFQLIPILRFQVMHDYVCFIAPIDYCVK